MTKGKIIERIAQKTGMTQKEVDAVVELLLKEITNALKAGGKVHFRKFGNFFVQKRKSKTARDIGRNKPVYVEQHLRPVFKASKILITKVNGKKVEVKR